MTLVCLQQNLIFLSTMTHSAADSSAKFHVVTSTKFDFEQFIQRAARGEGPRHTVLQLKDALDAKIHQPDFSELSVVKSIKAKIPQKLHLKHLFRRIGRKLPSLFLAKEILEQVKPEDTIYCCGEDVAIPLAILLLFRVNRPRLVTNVMFPERRSFRLIFHTLKLHRIIHTFVVNTGLKAQTLKKMFNLTNDRVVVLREQTDKQFFFPEAGTMAKPRPLIGSAGLEQRDYITLAAATQDLDFDVKVCAVSPNASSKQQRRIPKPVPKNMEMRHFDWVELRDLYRSADITVVCLVENVIAAGLTTLMEAMACCRPVIITKTVGLATELVEMDLVWGVQPGDVQGLRTCIEYVLAHPEEAEAKAKRAYQYFLTNHTSEGQVEQLTQLLRRVAVGVPVNNPEPANPRLA
jgi:Glycosyl transferases group 1